MEDSTSMTTTSWWHRQGLHLHDLNITRLETGIQYTLLGEGRLTGTLEKPVDGREAWRSAMISCGKLHPDSKRRKNTSCPEAYLCNRKSLWALAWLTPVVTLAGTVLADVELRLDWMSIEQWSGELFGRPDFSRPILKHHEVWERKNRDWILRVKCTNLCRGLKPNQLAVSPVTDNLSLWTWIYLGTLNTRLIT